MKKTVKILSFFLVLTFLSGNLLSQDESAFIRQYSIHDGLSQRMVSYLIQDKKGYIWAGTQDGLNKYDGYSFKIYRYDPYHPKQSISSNYIKSICKSGDSAFWLATQEGLNRYDFKTDKFTSFMHDKANPNSIPYDDIFYVYEDKDKLVWLRTAEGLIKFNQEKNKFYFYKKQDDEFSYSTDYNHFSIVEDNNNKIWTGSIDGLVSFDKKNSQFHTLYPTGESENPENEVFDVFIDNDESFWIGTQSGLYHFNVKKESFKKIEMKSEKKIIRSIFRDSDNRLWLGTDNGLAYLDSGEIKFYKTSNFKDEDIVFGKIFSLMEDKSKILWIGGQNGLFKLDKKERKFELYRKNEKYKFSARRIYSIYQDVGSDLIWLGTRREGLNIFNRKTGEVKVFNSKNSGLKDNDIHSIQRDNKNNIWIGTSNGAYRYNRETKEFILLKGNSNVDFEFKFKNNRISQIFNDKQGNYWFATGYGLYLYTGKTLKAFVKKRGSKNEIAGNFVLRIIQRKNGDIWIATISGLSKYLPKTDSFINYTTANSNISKSSLLTVFESSDNTLWIGTETGLNRYIDKENDFEFYTQQDGFNNDYIYAIEEDEANNLWLSTNKGIIRFNPKTKAVMNFTEEDGLQDYEYNVGACFKNDKNEIMMGGTNGFNIFNPSKMKFNKYNPKPLISRFLQINDDKNIEHNVETGKIIELNHNENDFTIYFTMPEYTHPEWNTYKYRIKELDVNWQNLGNENKVGFNRLSPGTYTFEVEAANSDKEWSKIPASLQIIIYSPWYFNYITKTLYILLGILLIVFFVLRVTRNARRQLKISEERERISKQIEEQSKLIAQKNNDIHDSINYAKRIIEAMMPSKLYFKRLFPQSFILFKPKDIVSGDFYWISKKTDKIFVATVDCTGHGVPGAFMSIVGLDLLRNIISIGIESPNEILNKLNKEVSEIFENYHEDKNSDEVKDGMDIAICAIDKKNKILEFAGAKSPLYLIRNNKILKTKGDRFSIGPSEHKIVFKNNIINLEAEDVIYMFSDGYVDQFGGADEKKFKYRRFRHMLLQIYKQKFEQQNKHLNIIMDNWKKDLEQVDDILVVGIKPLA